MSHAAEQFSWAPLPTALHPGGLFPIKSLALSACVSSDNSFPSVRQERSFGPWKGSPFLQQLQSMGLWRVGQDWATKHRGCIESKEKMWTVAPAELGGRKANFSYRHAKLGTVKVKKEKLEIFKAAHCSLYLLGSQEREREKLIPLFFLFTSTVSRSAAAMESGNLLELGPHTWPPESETLGWSPATCIWSFPHDSRTMLKV